MARNNPLSLGRDLAIDLGTANTLIYVRGHGVVLDEPSVVAINANDGRPVAVGMEAKRMMGRTPNHIKAIRPLKDGVIADFEVCEKMLRYFIQKVAGSKWSKPRMVICVPSGITGVEQRAVQDAAEYAGARKPVHIIEEPMAAAIGADMPVHEPSGNMIVDIGGGTTEVAVISLGGIVTAQSIRVAGDELDEAILQYVKKEFSLAIGDRTAEEIKIQMGSAWPMEEELTADIRGRDLISGLPRTIEITTEQIREAVAEPISAIVDAVKTTLDKTPPELAADIMEDGITITGGGALLGGLAQRLDARDRHADPHRRRTAVQRRHRVGPGAREHRRDARPDVARRRGLTLRRRRRSSPPWPSTPSGASGSSSRCCSPRPCSLTLDLRGNAVIDAGREGFAQVMRPGRDRDRCGHQPDRTGLARHHQLRRPRTREPGAAGTGRPADRHPGRRRGSGDRGQGTAGALQPPVAVGYRHRGRSRRRCALRTISIR